MIGRLWRGSAEAGTADAYVEHLRRSTLPELQNIAGYRGAYVLRRDEQRAVEFLVLTLWESLDAVRRFAGDEQEHAVVPPEARRLLQRWDDRVIHYEARLMPRRRTLP
jgi:heme-degrading monooxygenase HmoA